MLYEVITAAGGKKRFLLPISGNLLNKFGTYFITSSKNPFNLPKFFQRAKALTLIVL